MMAASLSVMRRWSFSSIKKPSSNNTSIFASTLHEVVYSMRYDNDNRWMIQYKTRQVWYNIQFLGSYVLGYMLYVICYNYMLHNVCMVCMRCMYACMHMCVRGWVSVGWKGISLFPELFLVCNCTTHKTSHTIQYNTTTAPMYVCSTTSSDTGYHKPKLE